MNRTLLAVVLFVCPAFSQAPLTLSLSPPVLPAGGPGFTLLVHFYANSGPVPAPRSSWVVRWNGAPRPTRIAYIDSNQQAVADIPASDITRPGFVEISVWDTATNVVYPASGVFAISVDVTVLDFVADTARKRFYVSVPAGGARPNAPAEAVVAVDAETGAVGPALSLGRAARQLAISDDARYLYAVLSGSGPDTIARVSLSNFAVDQQFPLAASGAQVLGMTVMPGAAGTLAVCQSAIFVNAGRVVIYDDGKPRPQMSPDLIATTAVFTDAATLVSGGYVSNMNVMKISAAGIASNSPIPDSSYERPWDSAGDMVVTTRGRVFSAQGAQLAGDTSVGGAAIFLPGRKRLLIAAADPNSGSMYLSAFDAESLIPLGRILFQSFSSDLAFPARMAAFGADGIAGVCGQQLCLGHTPLAGPAPAWTASTIIHSATGRLGAIAPGEIVSIFGTDLGPASGRGLEFSSYQQVSTVLGGAQVWFDGLAGTMLYAGAGQLNVVAPFGLAGKSATRVQVWNGGVPSATVTLPVTVYSPGIYTQDGSGKGPAALLNEDYKLNTAANAATAGSYAVLFGTGGGQTTPASGDGIPAASADKLGGIVRVFLNGQRAPVTYAGAAPGLVAGVMQVNFQIPAGFPASQAVNLQVEIGGVLSPAGVTMAVK